MSYPLAGVLDIKVRWVVARVVARKVRTLANIPTVIQRIRLSYYCLKAGPSARLRGPVGRAERFLISEHPPSINSDVE